MRGTDSRALRAGREQGILLTTKEMESSTILIVPLHQTRTWRIYFKERRGSTLSYDGSGENV